MAEARASGRQVEVLDDASMTRKVVANPDGSLTETLSAEPMRVARESGWVDVDTTLIREPGGVIRPRAAAADLEIGDGGDAEFAAVTGGSVRVGLSWDGDLPDPVLSGNSATYVEVLPGVDLVVTAGVTSVSEVVVVKNAKAAALPQIRNLSFPIDVTGGSLTETAGGGFAAQSATGVKVAFSPTPLMWDSSANDPGASATTGVDALDSAAARPSERVDGPLPGDEVQRLTSDVAADRVEVAPDIAMLTSPQTRFPVFIDPTVSPAPTLNDWTLVSKSFSTRGYGQFAGDEGVGRYDDTDSYPATDTKRQYYRFTSSALSAVGVTVLSAQFSGYFVYSGTCVAKPVTLSRLTGSFSSASTTWANKPDQVSLESQTFSRGRPGCATSGNVSPNDGWQEWGTSDALRAHLQSLSRAQDSTVLLGLSASETDSASWKRLTPNTRLTFTYNRVPDAPTGLSARVGGKDVGCSTTTSTPAPPGIVSLKATLRDDDAADLLSARFVVRTSPAGATVYDSNWLPPKAQGVFTSPSPSLSLTTGGNYTWTVTPRDSTNAEGPPTTCRFAVDTTAPAPPTVKAVVGTQLLDPVGGLLVGTGQSIEVTGAVSAVSYRWSVNDPDGPTSGIGALDTTNRKGRFTFTPTSFGPSVVRVWTYDSVGNESPAGDLEATAVEVGPSATWGFEVLRAGRYAVASGQSSAFDLAPAGDATQANGSNWASTDLDPSDGIDNRSARSLSVGAGSGGWASSSTPIVDTETNVSMMGLVYPMADSVGARTFLSVPGASGSALTVGLSPDTSGALYWSATLDNAKAGGAPTALTVRSKAPAQLGRWSHIAVVLNAGTRSMSLFVDGLYANMQGIPSGFGLPSANGFRLGSATSGSTSTQVWRGYLDEFLVFKGSVSDGTVATQSEVRKRAKWPN